MMVTDGDGMMVIDDDAMMLTAQSCIAYIAAGGKNDNENDFRHAWLLKG